MNNVSPGVVILALACGILLLALIWHVIKSKRDRNEADRRSRAAQSRSQSTRAESALVSTPAPAPVAPAPTPSTPTYRSVEPDPDEEEEEEDNKSFGLMKDSLRAGKARGTGLNELVPGVKAEFDDRVTMDEIFKAALMIGFPLGEVAAVMSANAYQPCEIVQLMDGQDSSPDVADIGLAIASFTEGTTADKAEAAFGTIKEELSLDDDNEELLALPGKLGCSQAEAAGIVYRGTDFGFADVLVNLNLLGLPDVIAQVAKDLDQDISSNEDYKVIRDADNIEFEDAVRILKACGSDAGDCIVSENDYSGFEDSEESVKDIFSALSPAGFSNEEIMGGIVEADVLGDNEKGAIVSVALEMGIPVGDITSFLKSEQVDADTLDDELRDIDTNILTRIDFLHTFLHADDKPAPEEVVQASDPASESEKS